MTLTVLTWFWDQPGGKATYTAEHVNIWAAMVRRHLKQPHRLACVTEIPTGIDRSVEIITPPNEFRDIVLPTWKAERPQCLRRLTMFRPDAAAIFGERFVCMDLDCAIGGGLDPLFDTTDDFRIYRGTASGRPYNGSMMLLRAGARSKVYETFTPAGAIEAGRRYVGSDQAWISHVLGPREATWGVEHGVCWFKDRLHRRADARLMFFPGAPKPWQVVQNNADPWVVEHYRGDRGGRCLVAGYAPTVWDEIEAAPGQFDALIASPEVAEHMAGKVLAVAADDDHARRLVRMHGFSEAVYCGQSEREAA